MTLRRPDSAWCTRAHWSWKKRTAIRGCCWGPQSLGFRGGGASTTLSFVYARDREDDGVIEALLAAVGAVWQLAAARSLPRRLRPVG